MGLPQDNAKGFREGSPITYAHQLQGNLLIVHGTADDNVHYQGVEALVNELVRLVPLYRFTAWSDESDFLFSG